jgi:adenosylcobinamide-phosphate synthase
MAGAILLDLVVGDPPTRWHPVAWLGGVINRLERAVPTGRRVLRLGYGLAVVQLLVGGSALAGSLLARAVEGWPHPLRVASLAAMLKLSFSLRNLAASTERIALQLEAGQLVEARSGLRALVSRPTDQLDTAQAASAAIESVAENLSDSLVAPLLYYALFGLPGALAYRAANTLDAMIGYHGEYEELGKAAARLDDVLNLLPARLSAVLLVTAAWLGFGDGRRGWSTLRLDHAQTQSPNAGWPMSAAAGALKVRLRKTGHYELGKSFADPAPKDIRRAVRLCCAAGALGIGVASAAAMIPSIFQTTRARLAQREDAVCGT